jgi:hypothetical protein
LAGISATITETVTVGQGPPTTATVDALFLFDDTTTMRPFIRATQDVSTELLNSISSLGDVRFGVGRYRNFPVSPFGLAEDTPFGQLLDLTPEVLDVET